MREQQRMSVWPQLNISNDNSAGLLVTNNGVGPALIRHAVVTVDGEAVKNWRKMFEAFHVNPDGNFGVTTITGRVLPVDREISMLKVAAPELVSTLRANLSRVEVDICYCSIYGDCYLLKSARDDKTIKVDQCSVDSKLAFEN